MTHRSPRARVRPHLALWLALAGLAVVGGIALVTWAARPQPGSTPTITYSTEAGPAAGRGVVNSPLRATVQLPVNATPTPVAVELILLDSAGQPAVYGAGAAAPLAMRWTGTPGGWEYSGSLPSRPGRYHARLQLHHQVERAPEILDFPTAVLEATTEVGPPLRSGYVFAVEANLWLLQTDTSRVRRVTTFPNFDESASGPAWSPSGEQIAFVYAAPPAANGLSQTGIWTVQPDGGGLRPLVTPAPDEMLLSPTWAADGQRLYFSVDRVITGMVPPGTDLRDNRRIDQLDLQTGTRSVWQAGAQNPAVGGPAGDLVFLEDVPAPDLGGTPGQRLILQASDGARTVLVEAFAYPRMESPRIAPDGRWVVFSMSQGTVPSEEGGDRPGDVWSWLVQWLLPAPVAAHGAPWDLYLVPATGGRVQRLTTLNDDEPTAVWLNSNTLAFMATKGLFTLTLDERGTPLAAPSIIYPGSPHSGLTWQGP